MKEKKQLKLHRPKLDLKSARVRHGGYSAAVTVLVLVILVVVNLLMQELPSKYVKIDTSSTNMYSLGDTTEKIVTGLGQDVTIYVLAQESAADSVVSELLSRYQDMSDHIKVQYVDPAVNPGFAAEYGASTATAGSLVMVSDKRSTLVDYSDIYVSSVDYMSYYTTGEYSTTTSFDGEGLITSAIDYVVSDTLPVMYTLTGHGEASLSDDVTSQVNQLNIELQELNLMTQDGIPEDASAILINQPTKDLSEEEKNTILSYMEGGGSVFYIPVLTSDEELTNFDAVLSNYGITLTGSLVVEGDSSSYYQYPYMLLPTVNSSSDITSPIHEEGFSVLLLNAQGIQTSEDLRDSVTVTELLTTSDSAYGKKIEGGKISTYEKEDGDATGPFALAVAAEEELDEDASSKLVVISSEALLEEQIIGSLPVANVDLFLNSISWMCGHESTISISSKDLTESQLVVPAAVVRALSAVTMVLIPVGLLAAGIAVWIWRRRK